MVEMKKYIASTNYGYFFTADNVNEIKSNKDVVYYTEYANKDKQVEGILKRTRMGGKSEKLKLQYLFNLNSEFIKQA